MSYNKKYYEHDKDAYIARSTKYQQSAKGKEVHKKANIKYKQSKKGKETKFKTEAKCKAKRKRNLQWIPLFNNPFDESEIIHWHHITDIFVVAIPKNLHYQYMGKSHRDNTIEIVKQIYGGD